jgi:hypothetical protein
MSTVMKGIALTLAALGCSSCALSERLWRGGGDAQPDSTQPSSSGPTGNVQRFRCESDQSRHHYCGIETRDGVQLVRQLSKTPCVRGRSWDFDRHGVWVAYGCRAEFATGDAGGTILNCESIDNQQRRCDVAAGNGVELTRQLSKMRCVESENWGWDAAGIWVDRGCRAEFRVR